MYFVKPVHCTTQSSVGYISWDTDCTLLNVIIHLKAAYVAASMSIIKALHTETPTPSPAMKIEKNTRFPVELVSQACSRSSISKVKTTVTR